MPVWCERYSVPTENWVEALVRHSMLSGARRQVGDSGCGDGDG